MKTLSEIISEAMADIEQNGYHSPEQIEEWMIQVQAAAEREYPAQQVSDALRRSLDAVFSSQVSKGGLAKDLSLHPYKIHNLTPKLRNELDRRVMASAQLIRLNRNEAMARTLKRFAGWATSVPVGGGDVDKRETKTDVVKSLKQLSYIDRRLMIDQAAKFKAALTEITALDNGAIFAYWKSQWRVAGYNYDKSHKSLDGKVFVVRDNWAMKNGLMKLDGEQYTDEVKEAPSQRPFCQCRYSWRFDLADIPENMLTEEGREYLKKGK